MVKLPLFLRTKLGHIQYFFTPFLMGIPHNFTLFLPYNCFLTSPFPSHLPSSLVNLLTLSFDHFCYFVIFVTLWLCDCVILSFHFFTFNSFIISWPFHILYLSSSLSIFLSFFPSFYLSLVIHLYMLSHLTYLIVFVICDLVISPHFLIFITDFGHWISFDHAFGRTWILLLAERFPSLTWKDSEEK